MAKKSLGRGLDALLADNEIETASSGVTVLRLSEIEPNRNQARKVFDTEALEELASSIAQHGLIQPIVVRPKGNGFYEIIAGERRWRASKMAGLTEVPVVVKETDGEAAALMSLIENLQREDLNPVEEANGYRELMESFDLTQEEAAVKVGKSRAAVANLLRILNLPESVLELVSNGYLSYGHARTLLPLMGVISEEQLLKTANSIIDSGISVRETEKLVKSLLSAPKEIQVKPEKDKMTKAYFSSLEKKICSTMGRKVSLSSAPDGSGKLVLRYSSGDDLETLIKSLCGNDFFEGNI